MPIEAPLYYDTFILMLVVVKVFVLHVCKAIAPVNAP
jgi:hypothetical protein